MQTWKNTFWFRRHNFETQNGSYTRRMEYSASNLSIYWLWQIQLCWLELELWGGITLARQPHQLWFCITDVRLPHMWLTYKAASLIMILPHQFLHGFEATSPFVSLTHKCKAASHVRQPHLLLGSFKIVSSLHQFWNCDTSTSCEAASK